MEQTYTKLKANILSVGNYEAAISEMSEKKKSKVNFKSENTRETFSGGPDRVTTGTWGIYIAGKQEIEKLGSLEKEAFKNLKHLDINAVVDVTTNTYASLKTSKITLFAILSVAHANHLLVNVNDPKHSN